ncbi:MAG: LptA/OstA family protein, partial [Candidatus Margulisiibacteriota bacterium]
MKKGSQFLRFGMALIVIVGVGYVGYLIYNDNLLHVNGLFSDKQVEVWNTHISGYANGKLEWKVDVKTMWTGQNANVLESDSVVGGEIYDVSGNVIAKNIHAGHVVARSKSRILMAEGNAGATYLSRGTDVSGNPTVRTFSVQADTLKYYSLARASYYTGNILISGAQGQIRTETAEINHDRKQINITAPFTMTSGEMTLTGPQMTIDVDPQIADMSGGIIAVMTATRPSPTMDLREAELRGRPTRLTADKLRFEFGNNNQVTTAEGQVSVISSDKRVSGQWAYYDQNEDRFEVKGNVKVNSDTLLWVVRPDRRDTLKNEEFIKAIRNPVWFSGDNLVFDNKAHQIVLEGNVLITQLNKRITARKLVYFDERQEAVLSGRVRVEEKGETTMEASQL